MSLVGNKEENERGRGNHKIGARLMVKARLVTFVCRSLVCPVKVTVDRC